MNELKYKKLLVELESLNEEQLSDLAKQVKERKQENGIRRLVTGRFSENQRCLHCQSSEIIKHGSSRGNQRYRCKSCGKTFMPLTGTPLNMLHKKSMFLEYAACMADGLSIRKTAARLGISIDKSFRWRHRFLALLNKQKPTAMTGVVETDETYFPESYKGQRHGIPRAAKKRAGSLSDGSGARKVPVVVARQRGSRKVFDDVLPDTTAKTLTEALRPALASDAVLCTDGNSAYAIVAKQIGIQSGSFVASYHGKGGIGIWHVQGVNRYDSSLKAWMRRFNGVATKYLHHYLGWRRLLDRFHDQLTPKQFLFHAIRDYYVEQT